MNTMNDYLPALLPNSALEAAREWHGGRNQQRERAEQSEDRRAMSRHGHRKDAMWLALCVVLVLPALSFVALLCGFLLFPLFPLVGVALLSGTRTGPGEPRHPHGRATVHRLPATQRAPVAHAA